MKQIMTLIGLALLANVVFGLLLSFPLMYLWNIALVPATGLAEVSWIQMFGIYILIRFLFDGKVEFNK